VQFPEDLDVAGEKNYVLLVEL